MSISTCPSHDFGDSRAVLAPLASDRPSRHGRHEPGPHDGWSRHHQIVRIRVQRADEAALSRRAFDGDRFVHRYYEYVNFEVWTRLGSFAEHRGTYDGWSLIASGKTRGLGVGTYTPVPSELLTPVSIPGDNGIRGFYITLDSNHLIYKAIDDAAIGESDTKVRVFLH
jgi:hypothetical protein